MIDYSIKQLCAGSGGNLYSGVAIMFLSYKSQAEPVCCFVGVEPVGPRTCRTAGPADCHEEER